MHQEALGLLIFRTFLEELKWNVFFTILVFPFFRPLPNRCNSQQHFRCSFTHLMESLIFLEWPCTDLTAQKQAAASCPVLLWVYLPECWVNMLIPGSEALAVTASLHAGVPALVASRGLLPELLPRLPLLWCGCCECPCGGLWSAAEAPSPTRPTCCPISPARLRVKIRRGSP